MLDPDVWGTISDWVVVAATIGGIVVAIKQLERSARANEIAADAQNKAADAQSKSVEIERATLLRAIDAEFESESMYLSRKAIRAMRNRVQADMIKREPHLHGNALAAKCAEEFSRQLTDLWEEARKFDDEDVENRDSRDRILLDRYSELTRLVNWFETLGYMCRRELLPLTDILNVYDAAVIPTMAYVEGHIHKRREEQPYPNRRWMENAMWLARETVAYMKTKDELPEAVKEKANLFRS